LKAGTGSVLNSANDGIHASGKRTLTCRRRGSSGEHTANRTSVPPLSFRGGFIRLIFQDVHSVRPQGAGGMSGAAEHSTSDRAAVNHTHRATMPDVRRISVGIGIPPEIGQLVPAERDCGRIAIDSIFPSGIQASLPQSPEFPDPGRSRGHTSGHSPTETQGCRLDRSFK
jgi:hypothetical protein